MSLESDLKKMPPVMVQLTDAVNELSELFRQYLGQTTGAPVNTTKPAETKPEKKASQSQPNPMAEKITKAATKKANPNNATVKHLDTRELDMNEVFEKLVDIAGQMGDGGAGVRELIASYNGAEQIDQIDASDYPELLDRANGLVEDN